MDHFRSIWNHFKLFFSILDLQIFEFSNSVRNPPKNIPRPSQNHPQTIPNPSQNFRIFRKLSIFSVIRFLLFLLLLLLLLVLKFSKNVEKNLNFRKNWDGFGMVWGWFWDGLGVFSGRFRTDFEKSKIWEFRIEKLTLKWPQNQFKIS